MFNDVQVRVLFWAHTCLFIPVSYTHLDVYKRQVEKLDGLSDVGSAALRPELEHLADDVEDVASSLLWRCV